MMSKIERMCNDRYEMNSGSPGLIQRAEAGTEMAMKVANW